ncbi:hypothetical protein KBZ19_08885 [Synechococcus sp. L2F]|uniref:uridine kinase family protein n=1 Tax=Synechococcus sp. L2F TaxID=2823739 RepID=UPI0020CDBBCF|nr:hypothetical protein [Synechococcus sp. L2F]MCP9828600.1 hypothetical protein [Synechococcus sp. L2F]
MNDLDRAVTSILDARGATPVCRSTLVAITGIDGCGKGFVTARIAKLLRTHGIRVATINADAWLNLPSRRFASANAAEHFYLNAIRFDDMFTQLVLPLRDRRSLCVEVDFAEETATAYRRHLYEFERIDVIVLEGIYLLKRSLQSQYDRSFWIDCTFETALERAVSRGQEGLSPDDTARAYRTLYFPAQDIHIARDHPRAAATAIISNDPRLSAYGAQSRWAG